MILVFITNILTAEDKARISPALNALVGPDNWHIDLGDKDKVLRVESDNDTTEDIILLFSWFSYYCRPML